MWRASKDENLHGSVQIKALTRAKYDGQAKRWKLRTKICGVGSSLGVRVSCYLTKVLIWYSLMQKIENKARKGDNFGTENEFKKTHKIYRL